MTKPQRLAFSLIRDLGTRRFFVSLLLLSVFAVGMDRPVAPLKDPIFCGYLRLQESFALALGDGSVRNTRLDARPGEGTVTDTDAAAFLRKTMSGWRVWRAALRKGNGNGNGKGIDKDHGEDNAEGRVSKGRESGSIVGKSGEALSWDPIPLMRDLAQRRSFAPEDLYFYYRNSEEFAILLTGTIDPGLWRNLFPESIILSRDQGFSVMVSPSGDGRQLALHIRNNLAFLAPSELEGNLVDALRDGSDGLTNRFKTFRAMVLRQPLLAIETDLAAVSEQLAKSGNPNLVFHEPLSAVPLFRFIVDRQVVKAQFHVPDDSTREEVLALGDSLVAGLNSGPAWEPQQFGRFLAGLKVESKGQSVFIEGPGLQEAADLAGLTVLGLFSSIAESSFDRFRALFPPISESAGMVPAGAATRALVTTSRR